VSPSSKTISALGSDFSTKIGFPGVITAPIRELGIPDDGMPKREEQEWQEAVWAMEGFSFNTEDDRPSSKKIPNSTVSQRESVALTEQVLKLKMTCVPDAGSMGKLFFARNKRSSLVYALRVIPKRLVSARDGSDLRRKPTEEAVLRRIEVEGKNPFVVKLRRSFHDEDNLYLLMVRLPCSCHRNVDTDISFSRTFTLGVAFGRRWRSGADLVVTAAGFTLPKLLRVWRPYMRRVSSTVISSRKIF